LYDTLDRKNNSTLYVTGSVLGEKTINNTLNRSTNRIVFRAPIFIDMKVFISS